MVELTLDRSYQRGDVGGMVKPIQEWLCLSGFTLKIDGAFGPVTVSAVQEFQTSRAIPSTGAVDLTTWEALTDPMRRALATIPPEGRSLSDLTLAYAKQHLTQHPREVGGDNRGPWVRLYMGGRDGEEWKWCAGFSCYCLKQACSALGVPLPLVLSFSCDSLAASAKSQRRFLAEPSPADRGKVLPGSFFLKRRSENDWVHTGIVSQASAEVISTIEGNSNDEGSPNGYEVCPGRRGYSGIDFITI